MPADCGSCRNVCARSRHATTSTGEERKRPIERGRQKYSSHTVRNTVRNRTLFLKHHRGKEFYRIPRFESASLREEHRKAAAMGKWSHKIPVPLPFKTNPFRDDIAGQPAEEILGDVETAYQVLPTKTPEAPVDESTWTGRLPLHPPKDFFSDSTPETKALYLKHARMELEKRVDGDRSRFEAKLTPRELAVRRVEEPPSPAPNTPPPVIPPPPKKTSKKTTKKTPKKQPVLDEPDLKHSPALEHPYLAAAKRPRLAVDNSAPFASSPALSSLSELIASPYATVLPRAVRNFTTLVRPTYEYGMHLYFELVRLRRDKPKHLSIRRSWYAVSIAKTDCPTVAQ